MTSRHLQKYGTILSAISLDIVILSRHAIVNLKVNRNALVETSTLLKSGIILSVIPSHRDSFLSRYYRVTCACYINN